VFVNEDKRGNVDVLVIFRFGNKSDVFLPLTFH